MNIHRPILTKWKQGKTAQFIRRHKWFFGDPGRGESDSFFMIIFIYALPALSVVALKEALHGRIVLAMMYIVCVLAYMIGVTLLVYAALEE